MKTALKILLGGLVIIVAVVAYRTVTISNHYPPIAPISPIDIDENTVASHLSEFIQIKTLSRQVGQPGDELAFLQAHQWLENTYPWTFKKLSQVKINGLTLLLHWQGSNPNTKPFLWTGHMDVVPVEPGTEEDWVHPAFSGKIADGDIWGRGAIDMKSTVVAMMEAIEYLITEGYQPKNSLYIALTHDEEKGGNEGAGGISQYLKQNNIQAVWSMDEGGGIATDGMIPGIEKPVALVAVGEKGFISLKISAKSRGGHSSMPNHNDLALVTLAKAITQLNDNQFPSKLNGASRDMILTLAPEMPFLNRIALANLWLFEPLVLSSMEKSRQQAPMIRTSIAPVIIKGGTKENILPQQASLIVNFRIHPNDTADSLRASVEQIVRAPNITVSLLEDFVFSEASPMANIDSAGYKLITQSIREIYGDIIVAPNMTVGATDSKHYKLVADETYRFSPMLLTPKYLDGAHGTNERISVNNMDDMVRFYVRLMKNSDSSHIL